MYIGWVRRTGSTSRRRSGLRANASGLAICVAVGMVLAPQLAPAASIGWAGTANSDWFTPGNWNPTPPTSADTVTIDPAPFNPLVSGGTANISGLTVGSNATATLQVFNNGVLDVSGNAIVGANAAANGTLDVIGAGSSLHIGNGLVVGDLGSGSLSVQSGAAATAHDVTLGSFDGSSGDITVDGAGSALTVASTLSIGSGGIGDIDVKNGAVLSAGSGTTYLGFAATGTGAIVVNDATFNAGTPLVVGEAGYGEITLENGGVLNADQVTLGLQASSEGHVIVNGTGSQWIGTPGTTATIGDAGYGNLSIGNGGAVLTDGGLVGNQASGQGFVGIDGVGSVWNNADGFIIGNAGSGQLTIINGGTELNGGTAIIGAEAHSTGGVTIDGAGSALVMSGNGNMDVGEAGTGTLDITHGGTATAFSLIAGDQAGGDGTVTVDGVGSKLTVSGIVVGGNGKGTLTVSNGATLVSLAGGFVGGAAGGSGLATIDGAGSSWTMNAFVTGILGDSIVNVTNGAVITASSAVIGYAGSNNYVTIDGQGSSLSSQDLTLGYMNGGKANLTLRNGATLSVTNPIVIASAAGSNGTLNIGGSLGTSAQAPGTINAPGIFLGAGNGSIVFNHTSGNYVFSTPIAGTGTLYQESGTTILVGADNGFTGLANVDGGTLMVDAAFGGAVTALNSSTVGGNGSVANLVLHAGTTIAPGNGTTGKLTVNGDFVQDAGSTYRLDLTPTGSDLITIGGTADIAGTVYAEKVAGFYTPGTHYTILTAASGLTGVYDVLDQNAPFVDLSLSYDAKDVYLDVTYNNADFCDAAITSNQCATANGAQSLGQGNAVFDALAGQTTNAAARAAFDLLSGEIHASAKGVLIKDGTTIADAVTRRIRSAFGGAAAEPAAVLAYGEDGTDTSATSAIGMQMVAADTERLATWGSAFGAWGHTEGDGNAASLSTSSGGFLTGIDGLISDNWRLGVVTGYSQTNFNADERASSGNSRNYHLGLYGGTKWDVAGGALALRLGAAYSWHDISTGRSVVFPGFSENLSADYNAGTAQLFGELGYDVKAGEVQLEPFAGLAYVGLHTDGFTEKGGAAALSSPSSTDDVTFTTLGLRGSESFALGGMTATARGTLGWRHAFGDTTPLATLSSTGSDAFTIAGAPIARDAVLVEAGIDVALTPRATLGIDYRGQLAGNNSQNGFDAKLALRF